MNAEETPDSARAVRCFVRGLGSGSLATLDAKHAGSPYNSLVTYACDIDGSPIFLFSALSDHTRNLGVDERAALLVEAASGRRNPQTGPRATLTGTIGKVGKRQLSLLRDRFLARHPDAALYAGFGDFAFYSMTVERVHWVGGFAQARWMSGRNVILGNRRIVAAIRDTAAGVIDHMNVDHADAVDLYARNLLGRKGRNWKLTGVHPDGVDLRLEGRSARLDFDDVGGTPEDCRAHLVALAGRARAQK